MKHGICKYCGMEGSLVKSHIIPESFYDYFKRGQAALESIAAKPGYSEANGDLLRIYAAGEHPKKSPNGIYDEELFCQECERKSAVLDDYGAKVLLPEFPEQKCFIRENGDGVYIGEPYNYANLKLFFLSVLWRMSATTHPFFKAISLGPHEKWIANMIKANDPGAPHKYAVILSRYTDLIGRYILPSARRERLLVDRMANIMYFGGYKVRVLVDSQPAPNQMLPFVLQPGGRLTVALEDSRKSNDFSNARPLVMEAERLKNQKRDRAKS